jgi:hypothetical protein
MAALSAELLVAALHPAFATDWPLFGFDTARSGFNSDERTLTVGNVHRLHKRWQVSLGAVADSTPILLEHVRIGRAEMPMLFQTRLDGVTLGIEATRQDRLAFQDARFDRHRFHTGRRPVGKRYLRSRHRRHGA